jgi:hypothetical protein
MHPGADPSRHWCTRCNPCRAAVFDTGTRRRGVTPLRQRRRTPPGSSSAKRPTSSGSRIRAPRQLPHSASAARHSSEASCRSSRRFGAGTRLIPSTRSSASSPSEGGRRNERTQRGGGQVARRGLPVEVVARIRDEYAQGKSLGAIANDLNSDRVPTAQGGRQWWPSTVRDVLLRSSLPQAAAGPASRVERPEVLYYDSLVDIHPSARKHGIADDDIEHATKHAMAIDDQDDDTRLYLGPSRSADLLEVVTIVRNDGTELAIHAMKMRPTYQRLLPGD